MQETHFKPGRVNHFSLRPGMTVGVPPYFEQCPKKSQNPYRT